MNPIYFLCVFSGRVLFVWLVCRTRHSSVTLPKGLSFNNSILSHTELPSALNGMFLEIDGLLWSINGTATRSKKRSERGVIHLEVRLFSVDWFSHSTWRMPLIHWPVKSSSNNSGDFLFSFTLPAITVRLLEAEDYSWWCKARLFHHLFKMSSL